MPLYGQLIVGPPGSGKTTYTHGISQFLTAINRPHIIINLDPANENIPYKCDIDIMDLITLQDVMNEYALGPNGALVYCMEYIEKNIDWLLDRILNGSACCKDDTNARKDSTLAQNTTTPQNKYLVIDCPGQVELYTNHTSILNIIHILTQKHDMRFTCVNLIDSSHLTDPFKYISILLLSLNTMLHLQLPHVNVLSKMDLVETYGKLPFGLEFYTDVLDLRYLLDYLNQGQGCGHHEEHDDDHEHDNHSFQHIPTKPTNRTHSHNRTNKYYKLNEALCSLLEDYAYVHFQTLCIEDKQSVYQLLKIVDRCNGYVVECDVGEGVDTIGGVGGGAHVGGPGTELNTNIPSDWDIQVRERYLGDHDSMVEQIHNKHHHQHHKEECNHHHDKECNHHYHHQKEGLKSTEVQRMLKSERKAIGIVGQNVTIDENILVEDRDDT